MIKELKIIILYIICGNLSYHLESRPKWFISLDGEVTKLDENFGIIYTGNPKVLKKISIVLF